MCVINTNKDILKQSITNSKIKLILNGEELSTKEMVDYLNIIDNEKSKKYLLLDSDEKGKYFILIYILFNYINSFTSNYDLILQNLSTGELIFRDKSIWEFVAYEDKFLKIKSLSNKKINKGLVSSIQSNSFYQIIIMDRKNNREVEKEFNKSNKYDSRITAMDNKALFNLLQLNKDCLLNNLDNEIIVVTSMTKEDIFELFENSFIAIDNTKLKISEIIPMDFVSMYGNEENIAKSSIHTNNLVRITNKISQAKKILYTNQKKTKFLFMNKDSYFNDSDNIIDYQLQDIYYDENMSNIILMNSRNDINGIDKLFQDFDIDNKYVILDLAYNNQFKVKAIKISDEKLNSNIEEILSDINKISIYKNNLSEIEDFIKKVRILLNYICYYYCLPLSILQKDEKIKNYIDNFLNNIAELQEELTIYVDIENQIDRIIDNLLEIMYHLEHINHKYQALININLEEDTLIVCKDKYIKEVLLRQDKIIESKSDILHYGEIIKNKNLNSKQYKKVIYLNIFNINKFEFIGNNIAPIKIFILLSSEEIRLYNKIINEYKKNIKHLKNSANFLSNCIKDKDFNDKSINESYMSNEYNIDEIDDFETVFDFSYKENSQYHYYEYNENNNVKVCKKLIFKDNKYMLIGNNTRLPVLLNENRYKILHHTSIKESDRIISIETFTANKFISELFEKYVRNNEEYKESINILDIAKKALYEYMNKYNLDYDNLSKEFEYYKVKRSPGTIKGWINSYKTIGSRQKKFYEAIYEITKDQRLKEVLDKCFESEEKLRNLKTYFRLKILHSLILKLKFNEDIDLNNLDYLTNSDIEKLKKNMDKYLYIEDVVDTEDVDMCINASEIGRILKK